MKEEEGNSVQQLRNCVKIEVVVLVPKIPDGFSGRKSTRKKKKKKKAILHNRAQELCESRGGRPGLPVPNSLYGLCGRKATLNWNSQFRRVAKSPCQSTCTRLQRGLTT